MKHISVITFVQKIIQFNEIKFLVGYVASAFTLTSQKGTKKVLWYIKLINTCELSDISLYSSQSNEKIIPHTNTASLFISHVTSDSDRSANQKADLRPLTPGT